MKPNMPQPIAVRSAATALDGDVQALVASALARMSAVVHGDEAMRRDCAAAVVADLEALAASEQLEPSLRQLCARLHAVWLAAGV